MAKLDEIKELIGFFKSDIYNVNCNYVFFDCLFV